MRVLQLITCAAYIAGASPGLTSAELLGGDEASLILTGGKIHVAGAVVEAMAVDAAGVIIATGSATDIGRHKGDDSKVIDLAGRSVLPGFHDLHVHPAYAGLNAAACVVPQGATLAELLALVEACVANARPGEWVTGGQWDASAIGGVPIRQMLDEVAPDNPVLLTATSGHSSWVNTKALQVADITRDTPDPEGGIIERDANGNPAGVLREYAAGLVRSHIPPPIETLITRETPGDSSGKSFGKDEAITLDQAIAMYTVNSARHVGTAHKPSWPMKTRSK